jgi:hypothetical protein
MEQKNTGMIGIRKTAKFRIKEDDLQKTDNPPDKR